MATITTRDFAALHALETYRHAITAAADVAAAAKAWIAVSELLTAAIVDDLCTLYALTYKYRCLWDAAGPKYRARPSTDCGHCAKKIYGIPETACQGLVQGTIQRAAHENPNGRGRGQRRLAS